MNVILLQKMRLGNPGDIVLVKPGYARNYLIPQGFATYTTPSNLEALDKEKERLLQEDEARLVEAHKTAKVLENATVSLACQAGEDGRLFGSIRTKDIIETLKTTYPDLVDLHPRHLLLTSPIKYIGIYTVELTLHTTVKIPITVVVERI